MQICSLTNLFVLLNSGSKMSYAWVDITEEEIYKFFALPIYMVFVKLPNIESFWSVSYLYHGIWAAHKFKSLLAFLHVVCPFQEDKSEKLHKN